MAGPLVAVLGGRTTGVYVGKSVTLGVMAMLLMIKVTVGNGLNVNVGANAVGNVICLRWTKATNRKIVTHKIAA